MLGLLSAEMYSLRGCCLHPDLQRSPFAPGVASLTGFGIDSLVRP